MKIRVKTKLVEINFLTILLFIIAYYLDFFYLLVIAYISATIHEFFHIVTAKLFNIRTKKLSFLPFGISATLDCQYVKNPKKEMLIAVSGPIANSIILLFCYIYQLYLHPLLYLDQQIINFVYISNIAILTVNLLPILPLDGGRILKAYLTTKWGFIKAFNYTMLITKMFSIILFLIGIWILIYTRFNFSLILVSSFIISNISNEIKISELVIMKDIMHSSNKIISNGKNANVIVASHSCLACKLLKKFSYNFYHIIFIVDSKSLLIGSITETQLIDSICKYGNSVILGDIV